MKKMYDSLLRFLRSKDRLSAQFTRYFLCGGLTFLVDVGVFYGLAWLVWPSLRAEDRFGDVVGWFGAHLRPVEEAVLLRNYYVNKTLAFLASNTVAYVTNLLFVFKSGRHSRGREIGFFDPLSTVSFLLFTGLSGVLIDPQGPFKWHVTPSYFFVFFCAMTVNFIMRKRWVFKG